MKLNINRILQVKQSGVVIVAGIWTFLYCLFSMFPLKVNLYWEPAMLLLLLCGIVIALFRYYHERITVVSPEEFPDPPMTRFFFASQGAAPMWFVLRMYVGAQWFLAGYEKAVAPGGVWWNGTSINGFAAGALLKATGAHPAVAGWYAWFLQHMVLPGSTIWGVAITLGELAVGLGILFGIATGIAAGFGVLMNFNYLLAGTVSINPVLGMMGVFLILAWKVCGYIGLDRLLLPWIGIPGAKRGTLFYPLPLRGVDPTSNH